jgi:hypothetical protein
MTYIMDNRRSNIVYEDGLWRHCIGRDRKGQEGMEFWMGISNVVFRFVS